MIYMFLIIMFFVVIFFFSSRRRHTRCSRDWSSDVCSSDLTGVASFQVRSFEDLQRRIAEADVLVISGLWRDDLVERATKLRFIQSIGAGTDQFGRAALAQRGIRLASARGVNAQAVAEHAIALILALARRLPEARDNQRNRVWRGMKIGRASC